MNKNEKVVYVEPPFDGSYYGDLDNFIQIFQDLQDANPQYKFTIDLYAGEEYGDPIVRCKVWYTRPKTEEERKKDEQEEARFLKSQKAFYEQRLQELEQKGF